MCGHHKKASTVVNKRTSQDTDAPRDAHASHASAVATTMSTPNVLSGDEEESTSNGVVEERLTVGGNVTSLEKTDALTDAVVVASQGMVVPLEDS